MQNSKKEIHLNTQEDLKIYMSPTRQELLHLLAVAQEPQTAKALADRLQISASSVQMHLKKLAALGLVEVDHQAKINGITATYYRAAEVQVCIGVGKNDALRDQREALSAQLVNRAFHGFVDHVHACAALPDEEQAAYGDLVTGVVCLAPEDRRVLLAQVRAFLSAHERTQAPGDERWSVLLMAYREDSTL